jgi:putative endonuclease
MVKIRAGMALHNELGRKGEQLAEEHLTKLGYTILFRNWRCRRYEIDIIATRDNILHFIEVKTRRSDSFGMPEESVGRKKLRRMVFAGEAFTQRYPNWKRIQFNILSISFVNEEANYFLIEDVYL